MSRPNKNINGLVESDTSPNTTYLAGLYSQMYLRSMGGTDQLPSLYVFFWTKTRAPFCPWEYVVTKLPYEHNKTAKQ